jgi:hypothetical protein
MICFRGNLLTSIDTTKNSDGYSQWSVFTVTTAPNHSYEDTGHSTVITRMLLIIKNENSCILFRAHHCMRVLICSFCNCNTNIQRNLHKGTSVATRRHFYSHVSAPSGRYWD